MFPSNSECKSSHLLFIPSGLVHSKCPINACPMKNWDCRAFRATSAKGGPFGRQIFATESDSSYSDWERLTQCPLQVNLRLFRADSKGQPGILDSAGQSSCHQKSAVGGSAGYRRLPGSGFLPVTGSSAEVFCQDGPTISSKRLAAMLQASRVGLEVPPVPLLSWLFRSHEPGVPGGRHKWRASCGCAAQHWALHIAGAGCPALEALHRATWKSQTQPQEKQLEHLWTCEGTGKTS